MVCYVYLWFPTCDLWVICFMQPIVFYLARLLCLPGLLCLLLSSMPTWSPAPVSICTESVCLVSFLDVLGLLCLPCLLWLCACYADPCGQHFLPGWLWSALPCLPGRLCLLGLLHLCLVCCAYVPLRSPMPYPSPSIQSPMLWLCTAFHVYIDV